MAELGIDISGARPQVWTDEIVRPTRDEIDRRVRGLLAEMGVPVETASGSCRGEPLAPGSGAIEFAIEQVACRSSDQEALGVNQLLEATVT